jgi:hypothetical protein
MDSHGPDRCLLIATLLFAPIFATHNSLAAEAPAAVKSEEPTKQEEPKKETAESKEVKQAGKISEGELNALLATRLTDLQKAAAERALRVIRQIIEETRATQATVLTSTDAIRDGLLALQLQSTCDNDCAAFLKAARTRIDALRAMGFSDDLFQNKHLAHLVQVRLPRLQSQMVSLLIDDSVSAQRREDFLDELTLITERFQTTRRFRAGIGVSYWYLPKVHYVDKQSVDLTAFDPAPVNGSGGTLFNTEFDNRSVPSVVLSADVPFVQVDLAIPVQEVKQTIQTSVQDVPSSGGGDLLVRTIVNAELIGEFDLGFKFSLLETYRYIRGQRLDRDRYDVGFGVGMTGFRIRNLAETEVKQRTNPSETFDQLPAGSIVPTATDRTFNVLFISGFSGIRLSDEFSLSLEARCYRGKGTSTTGIALSRFSTTVSFTWYPTLGW